MLKDTKMELMMFATGQIYRKTGTGIKHTGEDEKAEDEDLHVRNSVKLLGKEEQIDDHLFTRIRVGSTWQRHFCIYWNVNIFCELFCSARIKFPKRIA